MGYVPGPMTPLRDVRKLDPGERLVIEDGELRRERYWSYPAPAAGPGERRSPDEWAEIVLDKLDESVDMRLMSDVPLGAMLSGGLDSSLIVGLMARRMDQPVKTFSVGFAGEDSELPDARRIAEFNGAEHHELEVALSTDADELTRLAWHLDEPLADLSAVGFLALCELAVSKVTVALSGQGADELLGGYRKHRVASLAEHWTRVPRPHPLRRGGRAAARPGPVAQAARRARVPRSRRPPAGVERARASGPAGGNLPGRAGRAGGRRRARHARAPRRSARVRRRSRARCTWTPSSASSTTC